MQKYVTKIAKQLLQKKVFLSTAESCTGGWVAQELTAIAGSSEWFDCGFVTYSNESKQKMLGVMFETLEQNGAVSQAVVAEMAEGVIDHSRASISVATSGIAGPGGGSEEKPVGTVWFAWAEEGKTTLTEKMIFTGDRESVRKQSVRHALKGILKILSS